MSKKVDLIGNVLANLRRELSNILPNVGSTLAVLSYLVTTNALILHDILNELQNDYPNLKPDLLLMNTVYPTILNYIGGNQARFDEFYMNLGVLAQRINYNGIDLERRLRYIEGNVWTSTNSTVQTTSNWETSHKVASVDMRYKIFGTIGVFDREQVFHGFVEDLATALSGDFTIRKFQIVDMSYAYKRGIQLTDASTLNEGDVFLTSFEETDRYQIYNKLVSDTQISLALLIDADNVDQVN